MLLNYTKVIELRYSIAQPKYWQFSHGSPFDKTNYGIYPGIYV